MSDPGNGSRKKKPPPRAVVVVPYVRGPSEGIRRVLRSVGVKCYFKPHSSLGRILSSHKDPVPREKRTGVVYRVPCGACSETYVGQTGRTVEHRLKEHKRALVSGDTNTSALAEHAIQHSHRIAWEDTTVLDNHLHVHQRCAPEAWHIRQQPSPMNREKGLLPAVYDVLLRQYARH